MDEEIVDEIKWTSLAGQSLIFRKSLRCNVIASTCAGGVWGDAIPKIEFAFLPDRGGFAPLHKFSAGARKDEYFWRKSVY